MPDNMDKKIMAAAQGYRAFWAEHPAVGMGLGFVPVLGQALGALDALAAYGDPEASKLERGLATAGVLPMGKAVKYGRDFIIGKKGLVNLRKQRAQVENAAGAGDQAAIDLKAAGKEPGSSIVNKELVNGEYMAEIMDDFTQLRNIDKIQAGVRSVDGTLISGEVGKLKDFLPESGELFAAYPWLRDVPVIARPKTSGGLGAAFDGKGDDFSTYKISLDIPAGGSAASLTPEHVADMLAHEMQHGMQRFEKLPLEMLGDSPKRVGMIPYMANPGEIMSRVTEQRRQWSEAERRAIPFRDHWKAEFNRVEEGLTINPAADPFARLTHMMDPEEVQAQLKRSKMGAHPKRQQILEGPQFEQPKVDPSKGQFMRTLTPAEFGSVYPDAGRRQQEYLTGIRPNPYRAAMARGETIPAPKVTAEWDAGLKEWYVQDADGFARAMATHQQYGPGMAMPVVFNTRGIKPGAIDDAIKYAPIKVQPNVTRKP